MCTRLGNHCPKGELRSLTKAGDGVSCPYFLEGQEQAKGGCSTARAAPEKAVARVASSLRPATTAGGDQLRKPAQRPRALHRPGLRCTACTARTACTAHGSGRRPGSPCGDAPYTRLRGAAAGTRTQGRRRPLARAAPGQGSSEPRSATRPRRPRPRRRGPRPAPPPPRAGPCPDPCQAPAKSPRVTCASAEAGCGAPGLVWVPAGHSVLLSGRAAASEGTRGSDAKAAGRRRTQAEVKG